MLDLFTLHQAGAFEGLGFDSSVFGESTLNSFMGMDRTAWRAARGRVQQLLLEGGWVRPEVVKCVCGEGSWCCTLLLLLLLLLPSYIIFPCSLYLPLTCDSCDSCAS